MEEDIKILEEWIEETNKAWEKNDWLEEIPIPKETVAIENLIKEFKDLHLAYELYKSKYEKLGEENKKLKASHIMTNNKVSDEEKAKLFDVIDNSIDTYLEQTKPYWEQIMTKEKMTIEEAETIIDDMYLYYYL